MTQFFASDFDGTLTTSDSMFRMLRFHRGNAWLVLNLLLLSPMIIAMKVGLCSNHRVKEILLYRCFGAISESGFHELCQRFALANRDILRKSLYDNLLQEQQHGATVVVVSASPEPWVAALVPEFHVVGTKFEFKDGKFTGHFLTPNCYGPEKVKRLTDEFPELQQHRSNYHITAYGDSRGDRELLAFADVGVKIK